MVGKVRELSKLSEIEVSEPLRDSLLTALSKILAAGFDEWVELKQAEATQKTDSGTTAARDHQKSETQKCAFGRRSPRLAIAPISKLSELCPLYST